MFDAKKASDLTRDSLAEMSKKKQEREEAKQQKKLLLIEKMKEYFSSQKSLDETMSQIKAAARYGRKSAYVLCDVTKVVTKNYPPGKNLCETSPWFSWEWNLTKTEEEFQAICDPLVERLIRLGFKVSFQGYRYYSSLQSLGQLESHVVQLGVYW